MSSLYWMYETSIGDEVSISIRAEESVSLTEYMIFLAEFIHNHKDRITSIGLPNKHFDNSLCTILNMKGKEQVVFPNKHTF